MRRLPFAAASAVCLVFGLRAQPPSPNVPNPVLYRGFFSHIQSLEKAAIDAETGGKNAKEVRSYYQQKIGLSASELATLKQHAAQCANAIAEIDRQAKEIIRTARSQQPSRFASRDQLPKPPPELAQLTQQREDVTNAQIQSLRAALGERAFGKVDGYVHTTFAKGFSAIPIPEAGQPGLRPAPSGIAKPQRVQP